MAEVTIVEKVERHAVVFAVATMSLLVDSEKVKELLAAERKRYSGGFKNRQIHRGIPVGKEGLYPQFIADIGVSMTNEKWTERMQDYWAQFIYFIPYGEVDQFGKVTGLQIDASYTIDSEGKYSCANFKDYLLFEMMKTDVTVCQSPDKFYDGKDQYQFFCVDSAVETAKAKEKVDIKTKAMLELSKLLVEGDSIQDNTPKLRVLASAVDDTITGIHAKTMSREEAKMSLFKGLEKDPKALIEALTDNNLAIRSTIRQAVEANIILKAGNSYTYKEERIGNEDEMIAYLREGDNTDDLKRIKAQINEFAMLGMEEVIIS